MVFELFRHALQTRLRSTLIWGVSVGLVSGLTLASYAAFDPAELQSMAEALPSDMLAALGSSTEAFMTPEGYLGSQLVSFLPLALAFYLISGGARAIAGAEHEGSLDVVLSQPVPRWQVPVSSLLATALGTVFILLLYGVLTLLIGLPFGVDIAVSAVLDSVVGLLPICWFFGALAIALSATMRRSGTVTGVAGGLLVATYFMNTIALLMEQLDWLQWLTPFHYFGEPMEQGIDGSGSLVLLAATAVLVAASVPLFNRRDVRA